MPSYFYHLKLELYPYPAGSPVSKRNSPRSIYLPPPGSDIFRTTLPAHHTSQWTKDTFLKGHLKRDSSESASSRSLSRTRPHSAGRPEFHGDALLLPERNVALKESPSPALKPHEPTSESAAKDWRFDTVAIESIDMETMDLVDGGRGRGKSMSQAKGASSGLHTKGVYLPSDPKTTDVGWGVVHLYRDAQETLGLDADIHSLNSLRRPNAGAGQEADHFDPEQCTTLCILAVPSWITPSDFLGFAGEQTREDVSHFRLVRTGRANKYMVLMKFRQAKKAREWQREWNGKLFSAMEPENCHVVFIKSVEFVTPDSDIHDPPAFPQNTHDPFTTTPQQRPLSPHDTSRKPTSLTSKPLAPPTPSLIELPTCPVCLERMDETTGLLTILCQHVFHCACLEKWRGSGCPVCRYTQSPSFTFPYPRPDSSAYSSDEQEPLCSTCATTSNLWICLICGNIGCGRYDSAHAYQHYEDTSHCYAMDIATQHVWDYAGDGYVHRLIQNKDSALQQGKIDLPARREHPNTAFRAEGEDSVPREKMENMANEYTYLLTSQLEGQRRYFEEQVERAVDKASQASARAEEAATRSVKALEEVERVRAEKEGAEGAVARLEKELEKAKVRGEKFEKMAREMSKKLQEEKSMAEGLLERVKVADTKAKEREEEAKKLRDEKAELEDMNRDLTIFISSQERVRELQEQGEEVVDGTVSVPEQKKGRGKGRKK